MLIPLPSQTLPQEHLTVVYNFNPRPVFQWLASLTKAYSPFGTLPPAPQDISSLVRTPITRDILLDMNSSFAQLGFKLDKPDRANQLDGFSQEVTNFASSFSLGRTVSPARDFLFGPRMGNEPTSSRYPGGLTRLSEKTAEPIAALDRLAKTGPDGWLDDSATSDLAMLSLYGGFENISTSAFMSGEIVVPQGSPRDIYPMIERSTRIVALVLVLQQSIQAARLREMAALIMSPAFSALLDYLTTDAQEETKKYTTKLLAMKVHPWVAEVERLRVPARRYTAWGASSYTLGTSVGEGGLWTTLLRLVAARNGETAKPSTDVQGLILARGDVFDAFLKEAKAFFQLRDALRPEHVTSAESVLGLTSSGPAPMLHLHGQTLKALVMSGSMMSEAVADPLSLLLRPRFAYRHADGDSPVWGNADSYRYNAAFWALNTNNIPTTKPLLGGRDAKPPLYVEPHLPDFSNAYVLRESSPDMVKPLVDTEYFGDDDSVLKPYTPAGIAHILGYSSPEAMLANAAISSQLSHLLVQNGSSGWQKPDNVVATSVFISGRTRQPWRTAVEIPQNAMPTEVMAFDPRTAASRRTIQAVVTMTPELPALVASTLPIADAAARAATAGLGIKVS